MAKAKKQTIETDDVEIDDIAAESVIAELNGHQPDYRLIPIGYLETSPTNPRKRFPEATILELAGSIREKGILEPLIVRAREARKNGDPAFEIVCGERRYRASWDVGDFTALTELPCLVRELTDEEVLDIQIHENLHREDVHPIDEAYGYQVLREKLGCEVSEVAARVGKSEAYVLNRLKLNSLVPEVRKDIEDGLLPIAHALEIAKFGPDSQAAILNEGAYDTEQKYNSKTGQWDRHPIKDKPVLLNEFREWIAEKILWRLAKAPFDRKAVNLRTDGLACVNCPNRTGANAVLFDKGTGNNDSCLDPVCWKGKAQTHVQLTREKLAHEACVEVKDIPLVNTGLWSDRGDVLGYDSFIQIVTGKVDSYDRYKSQKACDASITTLDVSERNYGKLVTVCMKTSKCKVHHKAAASGASSSISSKKSGAKADEAARIQRMERKEEIFDMRVSDIVRKRVFRMAAEAFVEEAPSSAAFEKYLPDLVTKLWLTSNNGSDSNTLNLVVRPIMQDITDEPKGFGWGTWPSHGNEYSQSDAGKAIANLSFRNRMLLLFLFTHGNKGNTYSDRMSSQKEVRELAEYYDINYRLLDAEVRVQVAGEKAKKQIDVFKAYLAAVEAGDENAKIPRVWAESYKGQ